MSRLYTYVYINTRTRTHALTHIHTHKHKHRGEANDAGGLITESVPTRRNRRKLAQPLVPQRWPLQRRPETLMPAPPWCVQEPGGRQGSVDWPRDPCMADYYEPLHPMLPGLVRHVFEAEVVDLCIYTHTWMYVYIDICKYIDIYIYIYINIHTHIHTYIHIGNVSSLPRELDPSESPACHELGKPVL